MATHTDDYPNRVYKHPIDYFRPDPELAEGTLAKPVIYGSSVGILVSASLFHNYLLSRPIFLSGVHRHVGLAAVGVACAYLFRKWRMSILTEKHSAIRHYIELHPDDFPPYERRQYKDIFEPWVPRR